MMMMMMMMGMMMMMMVMMMQTHKHTSRDQSCALTIHSQLSVHHNSNRSGPLQLCQS